MTYSYDALIFDMDGTLWDAVDSYVKVWDATSEALGVDRPVTRRELIGYMGKTIDVIFNGLMAGTGVDTDKYLKLLSHNEETMMPLLGGSLYPGVKEGIAMLQSEYRLFMVSNCGADGLTNMLRLSGLTPYFEGTLTHGETGKGKDYNIKEVVQCYNLKSPLYIGDTQSDSDAAHKAGVDMCHAQWGFGQCYDAELKFTSFDSLAKFLMNIKSRQEV